MARPDVVVVDHHDSYTQSLVHLVAEVTGRLPRVVQHDEVAPEDLLRHSHVVLSPGPGRPDDPRDFAVGTAVLRAAERPVLGVCLGMQGLVVTWGGRVDRVEPAHGEVAQVVREDPAGDGLLAGVPATFAAVRYHSLAARALPPVLRATARTRDTGVVMAVEHVDLPQAGVQFHPESILSEHGALVVANFLGWG